ncbi:MAG: hypothetical protein ACYDBP_06600 [Leptospirales bacterium]
MKVSKQQPNDILERLQTAIFDRSGFALLRFHWNDEQNPIKVAGFFGLGGYLLDRDFLTLDEAHVIKVDSNDDRLRVLPVDLKHVKDHVPCHGRVSSDPEDAFCDFYFFA